MKSRMVGCFGLWKSELGDYRWSYRDAVAAGVIPTDLDSVYDLGVCYNPYIRRIESSGRLGRPTR